MHARAAAEYSHGGITLGVKIHASLLPFVLAVLGLYTFKPDGINHLSSTSPGVDFGDYHTEVNSVSDRTCFPLLHGRVEARVVNKSASGKLKIGRSNWTVSQSTEGTRSQQEYGVEPAPILLQGHQLGTGS